jgi:hypothetical protein
MGKKLLTSGCSKVNISFAMKSHYPLECSEVFFLNKVYIGPSTGSSASCTEYLTESQVVNSIATANLESEQHKEIFNYLNIPVSLSFLYSFTLEENYKKIVVNLGVIMSPIRTVSVASHDVPFTSIELIIPTQKNSETNINIRPHNSNNQHETVQFPNSVPRVGNVPITDIQPIIHTNQFPNSVHRVGNEYNIQNPNNMPIAVNYGPELNMNTCAVNFEHANWTRKFLITSFEKSISRASVTPTAAENIYDIHIDIGYDTNEHETAGSLPSIHQRGGVDASMEDGSDASIEECEGMLADLCLEDGSNAPPISCAPDPA